MKDSKNADLEYSSFRAWQHNSPREKVYPSDLHFHELHRAKHSKQQLDLCITVYKEDKPATDLDNWIVWNPTFSVFCRRYCQFPFSISKLRIGELLTLPAIFIRRTIIRGGSKHNQLKKILKILLKSPHKYKPVAAGHHSRQTTLPSGWTLRPNCS